MESENLELKDLLDSISSTFKASESSAKVFIDEFQNNVFSTLEHLLLKIFLSILVVSLSLITLLTVSYEVIVFCMNSYGIEVKNGFLVLVILALLTSASFLKFFQSKSRKNVNGNLNDSKQLWKDANDNIKVVGSKLENLVKSPLTLFKEYKGQFSSWLGKLKTDYRVLFQYRNTVLALSFIFGGMIFRKFFSKKSGGSYRKANFSDSSGYSEIKSAIKGLLLTQLSEYVIEVFKRSASSKESNEVHAYSPSRPEQESAQIT